MASYKALVVFGARRILARPGGLFTQHNTVRSAQYAEHGPDREREREGGNRNRHLGRGLLARSRQGMAAARLVTTHASAVSGAIDEGESAGRSKGPRLSEPPPPVRAAPPCSSSPRLPLPKRTQRAAEARRGARWRRRPCAGTRGRRRGTRSGAPRPEPTRPT